MRNFELALAFVDQDKPGKQAGAIWQNLQWTRYLAGMKQDKQTPSVKDRWQLLYLQAKQMHEAGRLSRLLDAEKEVSRLPYGWVSRSVLALVEQLYEDIVFLLFKQEKFVPALLLAEKGKKLVQTALAPQLR